MIVVMQKGATESQIVHVTETLKELGYTVHPDRGEHQTILGVVGDTRSLDARSMEVLDGVAEVLRVTEPYKMVSRSFKPSDTVIDIKGIQIGGPEVIVMAGPCSIENESQIHTIAAFVKKAGAKILRGGAFKPRTSPYSFQGLGVEGLKIMKDAADANGLVSISEIMDIAQIGQMEPYIDILQVGARNMQNFALLKELGKTRKPVVLKRGLSATIEELLMSAEYILSGGNAQVIFCERGIRTFETYTRNTMDISAIPVVKKRSHLPIIADPSHGIGLRDKVIPMARAAVAAGTDGLMIEVHNEPDKALSDGAQSLFPEQFTQLMSELRAIARAIGRTIE
ncbi:3-deoxy-7-phosphoheptulonate synthase [bacterium]|nr:3-deoxy-7-phosphoheptulonate synthase [bacterium]